VADLEDERLGLDMAELAQPPPECLGGLGGVKRIAQSAAGDGW
jgi:hypothetical protein